MNTDLEADLRDALHSRAAAVTPDSLRYTGGPRDRRRHSRLWPVLAAAAIVAALAATLAVWPRGHTGDGVRRFGPAPLGAAAGAPAAGTTWKLEALWSPDGTVARPPAAYQAPLEFRAGGRIVGSDTVNTLTGRYRPTAGGFDVSDVGTTLVAGGGGNRVRLAVQSAMRAIFRDADGDPVHVESHVDGNRLTLLVSGYTLHFRRVAG